MQILHHPKKNKRSQEHQGDILQQKMEAMKTLQTKSLEPNQGVQGDIITRTRPMGPNRVIPRAKTTPISLKNREERSQRRMVA